MKNNRADAASESAAAVRRGFTLVELLVVIGIIAILISIAVPLVSKVRKAAQEAATRALIAQLDGAIHQYHDVFNAYPGPVPNDGIRGIAYPIATLAPGYDTTAMTSQITGTENLVLGLSGGLKLVAGVPTYDPDLVGKGPNNLNVNNPKHYGAFVEGATLSWRTTSLGKSGLFADDGGSANDTLIPEYVDSFADPLPVIYGRARVGAVGTADPATTTNNGVVQRSNLPANRTNFCQYQIDDFIGYTGANIGVGRKYPNHGLTDVPVVPAALGTEPYYNAFPYLMNTATSSVASLPPVYVPRQKDSYILISAGKDRVYGTADDITNFGPVAP